MQLLYQVLHAGILQKATEYFIAYEEEYTFGRRIRLSFSLKSQLLEHANGSAKIHILLLCYEIKGDF